MKKIKLFLSLDRASFIFLFDIKKKKIIIRYRYNTQRAKDKVKLNSSLWSAVPAKISNIYGHYLKFLYDIKVFFVRHKTFLLNSTYIYMQQEPFFVNTYSFSVQH